MFEWLKNFFRRHRRKMVITGAVFGGAFFLGKYLQWKVEEWQEKETRKMIERAKKQQHFESNQRTCFTTFRSFLPNLRDRIVARLNTTELFSILEQRKPGMTKEEAIQVWEDLKIVGFSCTLCTIIATCILYMYLKIKVNIIGGYMFQERESGSGEDGEGVSIAALGMMHKEYFKNAHHFFDEGLPQLIEDVRNLVKERMEAVSLSNKFDHYQLSSLILGIQSSFCRVDKLKGIKDPSFSVLGYLLDQELLDKPNDSNAEGLRKLMQETADIIECHDFKVSLEQSIMQVTNQLLTNLQPHFEYEDPEAIIELDSSSPMRKQRSLPMAKIIPRVSGQTHEVFKAGRNEYLDAMFSVAMTEDFAANIYESFSAGCQ